MSNQEAHKYLRQNKPGIRNSEITAPPKDYVRPQGFQVVPGLIGRSGKQPGPGPNQTASYYEALQKEMSRYVQWHTQNFSLGVGLTLGLCIINVWF
jgi:hypothetical protein